MHKYLLLLFISFALELFAQEQRSPLTLLPASVQSIIGKTNKELTATFGEPDRLLEGTYFYEIENYRFRLIVKTNGNELINVRYVLLNGPSISEFIVSDSATKDFSPHPEQGHSKGRQLKTQISDKNGAWDLYFQNNSQRPLHSIVWRRP